MNMSEKGSVLPIMAAIVTGIGLVVAGLSVFSGEERATRLETAARPKLERIADSLVTYYRVTGTLPCPADGAAATGEEALDGSNACDPGLNVENKVVPWRSLGLGDALDPWENQISYRPLDQLTSLPHDPDTLSLLEICSEYDAGSIPPCGASVTSEAAFVIFSHGRPRAASENEGTVYGNGAFDATGASNPKPAHPAELANMETPAAAGSVYFDLRRTSPDVMDSDPENAFEQILEWRTISHLTENDGDDDDDECIPAVFAEGLAATGDGGITLSGNPQLNGLPSKTLTTKVLNAPNWGYFTELQSTGSAATTLDIPEAPENTSTEDYVAGNILLSTGRSRTVKILSPWRSVPMGALHSIAMARWS